MTTAEEIAQLKTNLDAIIAGYNSLNTQIQALKAAAPELNATDQASLDALASEASTFAATLPAATPAV